jgi:hypothetical protein
MFSLRILQVVFLNFPINKCIYLEAIHLFKTGYQLQDCMASQWRWLHCKWILSIHRCYEITDHPDRYRKSQLNFQFTSVIWTHKITHV